MKGCLGLHICVIFTVSRREYLAKKWPAGIVSRRSIYEFKIIIINTLILKYVSCMYMRPCAVLVVVHEKTWLVWSVVAYLRP
jgi:hypothetical protein